MKNKNRSFLFCDVELTKVEVFGRVIAPMSENATVDWVKRTALCDIPGNEGVAVKRDGLYRVTDKLLERKEKIEEFLREKEQGLFRLEEKIYLYDLTSSYFEREAEDNGKARYGYSRDGRGDCLPVRCTQTGQPTIVVDRGIGVRGES